MNDSYNPVHNILEFFKVLVQVIFTKSKTELDFSYGQLHIRFASRVVKQLKTTEILGKS